MQAFDHIEITLYANKFVRGGERGVRGPVAALLQPYDQDVHYTTYTEETVTRLRKDLPHGALSFRVLIYDLDAHGPQRATEADFDALVQAARGLPTPPNWISKSKNGAHALFLTSEIVDPRTYEGTRMCFSKTLTALTEGTIYRLDTVTSDWTRMMRAPRVLRTDTEDAGGVLIERQTDLRGARVEAIHGEILDITPWKTEPKPPPVYVQRKPPMRGAWDARLAARWIAQQEGAVSGGGGHKATFRMACRLVGGFGLDEETTYELMSEWNARCQPPWSERELRHKIEDAMKRIEETT